MHASSVRTFSTQKSCVGHCSTSYTSTYAKRAIRLRRLGFVVRSSKPTTELEDAEKRVLTAIEGVSGRGQGGLKETQLQEFSNAVDQLEKDGGMADPTTSDLLLGRWKLLFTSTPGTESPIQRTFTGVDAFRVFQDIVEDGEMVRVRNVVNLGKWIGALRVEAEGSTDSKPLPGFVPRKGEGLPLFGKSFTDPPSSKNSRIDFWFDRAAFKFRFLPFKIPYPVPFRLLGDETKGWLDITYLSQDGSLRLSRGNKGTLFVLKKEEQTTKEKLLDAILEGAVDAEMESLIEEMILLNPTDSPAKSPKNEGKFRQIWTKQDSRANPFQRLFGGAKQWQIIESGTLQNLVSLVPGLLKLRARAECVPMSDTQTEVKLGRITFEIPFKEFPVDVPNEGTGFVEWLYMDDDLKISKGSLGSYFIVSREK